MDSELKKIWKTIFKLVGIIILAVAFIFFGSYTGTMTGLRDGYRQGYSDGENNLKQKRDYKGCPINYQKVKCHECGKEYERLMYGNN